MKILLIGEYSRLHNSLKEGLIKLGHEVIIISRKDGFKNYPADLLIPEKYKTGITKKIKVLLYKIFRIDIYHLFIKKKVFRYSKRLKGFDIVQLINEIPLGASPKIEKEIFLFLKKYNKKFFLLSCGTDYISVKYDYEKKRRYSIVSPFFEGKQTKAEYNSILKYLEPEFENHHFFLYEQISGCIASDIDYHIPLLGHPKYLGMIPNPINTEKLNYAPLNLEEKIIIFHGINRGNYFKKGSDYFEKALNLIKQEKYADRVEIIIVENLPYQEYIEAYNKAHIVLDQVLGYDQGYNALEAMAKGKVVFTGAEKEWLEYYDLEEDTVAINALPNVPDIFNKLEWLILNPNKIVDIGKNAREFIEKKHNYIDISNKYIDTWSKGN